MAFVTLIHHIFHSSSNPPPDEGSTDELLCRPDTGVMDLVELSDNLLSQGYRDNDPGLAGGCVVVEHIPERQVFGRLLPFQASHLLPGQARHLLPERDGRLLHARACQKCSCPQVEPAIVFSSCVASLRYLSVAYWRKEKNCHHLLHADRAIRWLQVDP